MARDVSEAYAPFAWRRWLAWAVVLAGAAYIAWQAAINPTFEWSTVAAWFARVSILRGLGVTLGLTVVGMTFGTLIGLAVAIARMSDDRLLNGCAGLYIWFFRGTPLLVQLLFWYNFSLIVPTLVIRVPFGPVLGSWQTNDLITPTVAAIVGLSLNEAAYMAEVIRGGLLSVDRGQIEACDAFGMTRGRALRRIIIPQAMRAIIPPTGNQLISMIKATSLVSVIAMADLLYSVQAVYNQNFEVIPLLLVAVIWYLIVTSILNVVQSAVERHYGRGESARREAAAPA